jgi:hypothetical protein
MWWEACSSDSSRYGSEWLPDEVLADLSTRAARFSESVQRKSTARTRAFAAMRVERAIFISPLDSSSTLDSFNRSYENETV